MALEIERRFLVSGDAWRAHEGWVSELQQGYLFCGEDGLTARVRVQKQGREALQAWLTLKAPAAPGASAAIRQEFEYAIPLEDAHALLELSPWRLQKSRHGLVLPGGGWVVDVFDEANSPLVIAEVELSDLESQLSIPFWCCKEITGLHALSNAALARRPFQFWDLVEKNLLWQGAAMP